MQSEQQGPAAGMPQRQTIHDLRNLFAIVASARYLLERDPVGVERSTLLHAIEDAAVRGGRLTTALLAPDQRSSTEAVDPAARLADLAPMMTALAGPKVRLDIETRGRTVVAGIDASTFEAAILELVANANAADARSIVVRHRRIGHQSWILVSDDGCGMTADVLAQARTGVDGCNSHGTGLSRVHTFVRAAHGRLRIRSRAGRGTSIALVLPIVLSLFGRTPCVAP